MRSRILSLIFCILAFSITMVLVVQLLNPATANPGETSDLLTVEDDPSPTEELPDTNPAPNKVTAQTVTATAKELEETVKRLAYGSDKSYADSFASLSQRLDACALFLRDECADASGSAYFTVISTLLKDVIATPFADNSSFSVRMGAALKDLDAALPPQAPEGVSYPHFDTDPNGSFALAMLSVYRQQQQKPQTVTITLGGQLTLADAVSDTGSAFDTKFNAEGKNYPLHGVSPLLGTDSLTLASFANVLTDSTTPNSPLTAIKGKPAYAQSLKANGLDLALLTGSHLKDYGAQGMNDTVAAFEQSGMQALSFSQSTVIDSTIGKIAVLSYDISAQTAAYVNAPKADIQKAKAEGAKLVIVAFARATTDAEPNAVDGIMTKSARSAIDNGADLVVNYSQSVIQAIDLYKDHYIVYSPAVLFSSADKSALDNSHSFLFQQSFTLKDGAVIPSKLSVTPVNNGTLSNEAPRLLLDESADAVIDQIAKYSNNVKYTRYGIPRAAIDYICIKK